MQKILVMHTERPDLRGKADGWDWEDGDEVMIDKPIGLSSHWKDQEYKKFGLWPSVACYDCPLKALADGWKLLAPPVDTGTRDELNWEWWFVKD